MSDEHPLKIWNLNHFLTKCFIEKRLQHRYFSEEYLKNFEEYLRTTASEYQKPWTFL